MSAAASPQLTDRQSAVMERIDRRVPIKVIAQDLGVSETRINQHIRALKDIYSASSLNELVECHRASVRRRGGQHEPEAAGHSQKDKTRESQLPAFSKAAYSKNQVSGDAVIGEKVGEDDRGKLVMSDVLPLIEQAPWLRPGEPSEPQVVPGVLDGEHAVLFRLMAIVGIGFGFLGGLVLTLTAAITISEALDGRATVLADNSGPS